MISKYTINPPLITQPSDEIKIVGKKLEQWRDGLLIRVVDLIAAEKLWTLGSGEIEALQVNADADLDELLHLDCHPIF